MLAGVVLRARLPVRTAHLVNRAVIDVIMPVVLLLALWRARLDLSVASVLVPTSLAQLGTCTLAYLLARALALPRPAQGSAMMTTTFSNTGFLGFPVVLALFAADPNVASQALSAALLVDTVSTTVWLWSFGLIVAARFGSGRAFSLRGLARALVRPLTLCVALGLALSLAGVPLPARALVDDVVGTLGVAVSVLVFFSLGLSLDLAVLKGRALPIGTMALLKLLAMPLLVLAIARLLALPATPTAVAVLQSAMPSAMVSVIVSADEGCDRAFAAGVAALSTLLCVVTLPVIGWLLEQ
jgi:malate permease and related proteins